MRQRLEHIGATFLYGYHAALETSDDLSLELRLSDIEAEWRGFAFEGAAMGLTLLDFMTPWKSNRFQSFIRGPGATHVYMSYVGAGWALARLPVAPERALKRFDPLLGWLAIDGYGFHEGYFKASKYFNLQKPRPRLAGYAARVFDQGLGRSLWFVEGANVEAIGATVASFAEARQADLWSGVGLACAYAGGRDKAALETLRGLAGAFLPSLAQGVCFAARARQRADNMAEHTELACHTVCEMPAETAANICEATLQGLANEDASSAYEAWRQRIAANFAREVSVK